MPETILKSFNYKSNSLGFLRWLFAVSVIVSHSGPIAGLFSGKDLSSPWNKEESIGGVAVIGFFFISGFLITKSQLRLNSGIKFLWHRFLRIFPGYWFVLVVTALILGPIGWQQRGLDLTSYWNDTGEGPWSYLLKNSSLLLLQQNISNSGEGLPLFQNMGAFSWNTSIWTLVFEFSAYIFVLVLWITGTLAQKSIVKLISFSIFLLSWLQNLGLASIWTIWPFWTDYRVLHVLVPFAAGIYFQLNADNIPLNSRLGISASIIATATYLFGGWHLFGQYAFFLAIMWFASKTPKLNNWDKRFDLSYGIYLIGWPLTVLATYFEIQRFGSIVFLITVISLAHVYGFVSWFVIEKPAQKLKNFRILSREA